MDWLFLESWLLTTMPGIFTLSVLGSVVGSLVVYLVKVWWGKGAEKRLVVLQKAIFPLRIAIYEVEEFQEAYGPRTVDGKYVVYVVVHGLYAMAEFIAFCVSLAICVLVYVEDDLNRPFILSFFGASSLFFAWAAFKSFLAMYALISEDARMVMDKIEEESPKSLHEWKEMRRKQEEALTESSKCKAVKTEDDR